MAGETFYFFFSIIAVLGIVFYLASMLFFRIKQKTIFGERVDPRARGYGRMEKLSSIYGLTIPTILLLVLVANLSYSTYRIMQLDTPDAHFLLAVAPVVVLMIFGWVFYDVRQRSDRKPSKHR